MNKHDSLFVDHYETIRQMLHQLLVYGCYDRIQGALQQETSASSYSANIRRVKYFWPEQIEADRQATGKKISRFPFNRYSVQSNFLARSYMIHSFRPQDINLFVLILAALASGDTLTVSQLIVRIEDTVFVDEVRTDNDKTDTQSREQVMYQPMVRAKLAEMAQAGFLQQVSDNPLSYRIADNILDDFSSDELARLYQVVAVYRDHMPLSSLGYHIQRVLADTLTISLGDELPTLPSFERKNVFFQSILNDDLVYRILMAIEHNHQVTLCFRNEVARAVPLRLIYDQDYGRQYLFGYNENTGVFCRRLDMIRGFAETSTTFEPTEYLTVPDILKHVWNAAISGSEQSREPYELVVDFRFSADDHMEKARLLQDKRCESIEQTAPDCLRCRFSLYDTREMIPWLRTFGKCVTIPIDPQHIGDVIADGWKQVRAGFTGTAPVLQKRIPEEYPQGEFNDLGTGLFSEFRNAYFTATLELYNHMVLDGESFTLADMQDFYTEHTFQHSREKPNDDDFFNSIGSFSYNIREPALFRKTTSGHYVPSYGFCENNGDSAADRPPIPFLLMDTEKRWLCNLLDIPAVQEQLGTNLAERLRTALHVPPYDFAGAIARGWTTPEIMPTATKNNVELTEHIHIAIRSIHRANEIERAFMLFSTWKKEGWMDEETGLYHLRIEFSALEKQQIIEKILSLGPAAQIIEPDSIRQTLLKRIP